MSDTEFCTAPSAHLNAFKCLSTASESWRKERILDVPLCLEDCQTWYDDCTNRCPANSHCSPWTEIFPSAQDMCEKIWSNSYKYTTLTKDSGRCMQMWFTGSNPNKKVAEYYLNGAETVAIATGLHVIVLLMMLLH
ncbi:Folate receptor alpha [Labeo rohita]|uniref:Folate receptor alpha n=1 Tax=Labeo rohita TaxID=84645 RepID=A0ABQ8M0U3_LABRO|nr:Folate receptor alpha [Labeo rohita]